MLRLFRGICALALATLVLAGLVACTPVPPLYARLDGSEVAFLVCSALDANEILVEVAPRGSIEYQTVWIAKGGPALPSGTEISYGVAPGGWQTSDAKALDPAEQAISLTLGTTPLTVGGDQTSVVFAGWKLSEVWMDSEGTNVDDPC